MKGSMEKKRIWMTVVYAVNWLVVCFCCRKLYIFTGNYNVIFNDLIEGKSLPVLSDTLLHNPWILWLIPLLWGIATIALAVSKRSALKVVLHICASILLMMLIGIIYTIGLFLPLIKIEKSLGG
jgi:hypothetical protein